MSKPAQAEPSMEEILASIRRIIADEDQGSKAPAKPEAQAKQVETPVVPFPKPAPSEQDAADAAFAMPDSEMDDDEEVMDLMTSQLANEPDESSAFDPEPEESVPEPVAAKAPAPKVVVPVPDPFEDVGFVDMDAVPEELPEPVAPEPVAVPAMPPMAAVPVPAAVMAPPPVQPQPVPVQQMAAYAPPQGLLDDQSGRLVAGSFAALETAVFGPGGRTIEDITKELLRPMLKQWLDDNLPPLVERLVAEEIQRVSRGPRR